MDIASELRKLSYLAAVPEGSLAALAEKSAMRRLKRGEFVFHAGDPSDHLIIVASGFISIIATSEEGRQLILHLAGPGESTSHTMMTLGLPHATSTQAISPAEVIEVPAEAFTAVMLANPVAAMELNRYFARVILYITMDFTDIVFHDLPRRLARLLLTYAREQRIDFGATQTVLAARLGVTRQSFNRALADLVGRGWLRLENGGAMQIIDREALVGFSSPTPARLSAMNGLTRTAALERK